MRKLLFLVLLFSPFLLHAQTSVTGRIMEGLAAARPTVCSTGDWYYSTDTNTINYCTAPNTWGGTVTHSGTETFTGPVTAGKWNSILTVDGTQFTTCAAAVTAAGTVNKTLIIIPSNYVGAQCPANVFASNPNVVIWAFDTASNNPSNTSPGIGQTWNFNDTNVQAMSREQFTCGSTAPCYPNTTQSVVTHWWVTLLDAATGGAVADGIAAESDSVGVLTGTQAHMEAAEHSVAIGSTGGTVTEASAVLGYVNSNTGSTTSIGTARGMWARGCLTLLGSIPTNCYGIQADDQGTKGSSNNFALYGIGRNRIGWSAVTSEAGLWFDDHLSSPHQTIAADSSDLLNIKALTATGVALEDNSGNIQLLANGSGVQFRTNSPYPFVAGGLSLGKVSNPWSNICLGTAATNNICTSVAAMAAQRTLTVPDPLGNVTMPYVIASGTSTLTTASTATLTCQTTVTTAAANALTTDAIEIAYASAPTATTDGLMIVQKWVTAGNVNFMRCNPTAGTLVPTALVINWRVIR